MKNLFFFTLLFTTLTLFCQNIPCSNFKTGEFKYVNPKYSEWIVKRNDSIQVEISNKTGIEIYSLIEWNSDCEYKLTCNGVLNSNKKNIIGKIFIVSIKETYLDSYKCHLKSIDPQLKDYELEMIKIK